MFLNHVEYERSKFDMFLVHFQRKIETGASLHSFCPSVTYFY